MNTRGSLFSDVSSQGSVVSTGKPLPPFWQRNLQRKFERWREKTQVEELFDSFMKYLSDMKYLKRFSRITAQILKKRVGYHLLLAGGVFSLCKAWLRQNDASQQSGSNYRFGSAWHMNLGIIVLNRRRISDTAGCGFACWCWYWGWVKGQNSGGEKLLAESSRHVIVGRVMAISDPKLRLPLILPLPKVHLPAIESFTHIFSFSEQASF